jgi:hypothetical protein
MYTPRHYPVFGSLDTPLAPPVEGPALVPHGFYAPDRQPADTVAVLLEERRLAAAKAAQRRAGARATRAARHRPAPARGADIATPVHASEVGPPAAAVSAQSAAAAAAVVEAAGGEVAVFVPPPPPRAPPGLSAVTAVLEGAHAAADATASIRRRRHRGPAGVVPALAACVPGAGGSSGLGVSAAALRVGARSRQPVRVGQGLGSRPVIPLDMLGDPEAAAVLLATARRRPAAQAPVCFPVGCCIV